MEEREEQAEKKVKKIKWKMNKKWKIAIVTVLVFILLVIILIGSFIGIKLAKINFQDLDEANLAINDNLFVDVNGLTKKEFEQVVNFILLGSDSRNMDDQYEGNSDAIMVISVNPKYKSIKLISIPRDTAANIEGMEHRYKINYAFRLGGEQLAVKTINQTFNLNLREYVTINISAMYDIINQLGGVDLTITKEEMNWINEYIDLFYGFSGKKVEKVTKYGTVTLTGEQAAAHVKERQAGFRLEMSEHGDYGRTRRQRDVFISMLNKIASKNPVEISNIMDMILSEVTTNIDVAKYTTSLLPEILMNKDTYLKNIVSVMLPSTDYSKEIMERGAYIYVTDSKKAKKDFVKYMYEM